MELSPTNDDSAAVDLSGGTKVQSRPHVLHKCKKKPGKTCAKMKTQCVEIKIEILMCVFFFSQILHVQIF